MLGYAATNPTNAGAMLLTIIKTGPKKQFNSLSNRVYSPEHSPVSCLSKHIIATRPHTLEALEEKKSLRGVKKKNRPTIPYHGILQFICSSLLFVSFQRRRLTQSRHQGYPSRLPPPPSLPCVARLQTRPPVASIVPEPRLVATDERCSRLMR